MRKLALGITLAFCWISAGAGFAQQPAVIGHVELRRYGDLLRQHGIELTEPALISALKNPDPSVRFLAAMKPAEDKADDAVPAIEQALAVEKVPRTDVNIALALALLGSQAGSTELKRICADENFAPEFRLYAVRYLFDLHVQKDEGCLHATEEIAQIVDPQNLRLGDRQSALELLVRFQGLTQRESQEVFEIVVARLGDPEVVVRIMASHSLARLGNVAAIPYLQAAITKEQDPNIRSALEKDLKKLQATPRP